MQKGEEPLNLRTFEPKNLREDVFLKEKPTKEK